MGVQDKYAIIGKSGCTALCYCHLFGLSDGWLVEHYDELVQEGAIKYDDCYVLNANLILKVAGLRGYVLKGLRSDPVIAQMFDRGQITECVGQFKIGNDGHFVVLNKDGFATYNTLNYSRCVHDGELDDTVRVWVRK